MSQSKTDEKKLIQKFKDEYTTTSLHHIDYRESLSGCPETLGEITRRGYSENIDIREFGDARESIDYMLSEVYNSEERKHLKETDLEQELIDYCYEVDNSTPEKDLLKNTGDQLFLIDLNYYFEDTSMMSEEEINNLSRDFLKHINQEPTQELVNKMYRTVVQASYGGTAYVGLYCDPIIFYNEEKQNVIIDDMCLCIINHSNGSGDYGDIGKINPIIISRKNIHHDKEIKYSLGKIFGHNGEYCISSFDFTKDKTTI